MIDLSTIHSLELIQNLQHAKSRDCLFGILNQTLTPMGGRLLKSNLLQPLTEIEQLENRYEAVEELSRKEDVFFAVRHGIFHIHLCHPTLELRLLEQPSQLSSMQTGF